MHMARGGDAQGGEGGCTCILCIPPGYATGIRFVLKSCRLLSNDIRFVLKSCRLLSNGIRCVLKSCRLLSMASALFLKVVAYYPMASALFLKVVAYYPMASALFLRHHLEQHVAQLTGSETTAANFTAEPLAARQKRIQDAAAAALVRPAHGYLQQHQQEQEQQQRFPPQHQQKGSSSTKRKLNTMTTALVKSEPKSGTPSRSQAAAMLDITEKENTLKSAAGFAAEAKRRCKEEEQPTPPFSLLSEIANDCRSSVVNTAIETVGCEKETPAAGVQRLKVKEEKGEVMTLVMVGAESVDAATQFFSSSSSLSSSSSSSSSSTRSSIDSDSALSQVRVLSDLSNCYGTGTLLLP
jgi:hypothetical protein